MVEDEPKFNPEAPEIKDETSQENIEQEKPAEFRFLSLIKNQIRVDKKLEIQKEILFSNAAFNSIEAYRLFDWENKGYITENDLNNKFDDLLLDADAHKILGRFDSDRDGRLSLKEFEKLITPVNLEYQISREQPRCNRHYTFSLLPARSTINPAQSV